MCVPAARALGIDGVDDLIEIPFGPQHEGTDEVVVGATISAVRRPAQCADSLRDGRLNGEMGGIRRGESLEGIYRLVPKSGVSIPQMMRVFSEAEGVQNVQLVRVARDGE